MHKDDVDAVCIFISTHIVGKIRSNPKTKHLQPDTPEHLEAWMTGVEQVIERLQDSLNGHRKENNDV